MSVGGAPAHFFKYTVAGRETQHAGMPAALFSY